MASFLWFSPASGGDYREGAGCEDFFSTLLVNAAIKPFQSVGLAGERDIHKKPLDLPIPAFDKRIREHCDLVDLSVKARNQANELIMSADLPRSLARPGWLREQLAGSISDIDTSEERFTLIGQYTTLFEPFSRIS